MSERTAFPNGVPVPDDPSVKLTPEQLNALFSNPVANARVSSMLARHARPLTQPSLNLSQGTSSLLSVPEGVANGR